jgi:N-acetylmuramoyl-L-alanine amidase
MKHKFELRRRDFLLSSLAFCLPALSKEEYATLKFIPYSESQGNSRKKEKNKKSINAVPLSTKKIVVIDPGHGGKDPGAIGHSGAEEKHVVLEIANNVRALLEHNKHIEVRLTREEDFFIPLYERVNIAHRHNADMFMSIHADGFTSPAAHGASVFALSTRGASSMMARYLSKKENSADNFADINVKTKDQELQKVLFDLAQTHNIKSSLNLCKHMIQHIRGVHTMHSIHPEQAAFVVLKSPTIPSVLIETSFITNPREEFLLGTSAFRMKIAKAIAGGVESYFS